MAKAKNYVRMLRPEEYREILFTHGRRVANRVALAASSRQRRPLSDFYACYSPQDGLPEHERCGTGLINKFDPAAWFLHYSDKQFQLWPEPARPEGEAATQPPSITTDAARLRADIAHAARQIHAATSTAEDEQERDQRGNAMLSTFASTLSAKYGSDSSHEIYNALVDEINKEAA